MELIDFVRWRTAPNGAGLRVAGSKTGTVPAWGLSQAFAVQTVGVPWAASIWDSPEFATKVLKRAPFWTGLHFHPHPKLPPSKGKVLNS